MDQIKSSSTQQTVARNAGVLMASQLITWGLTLLLTIFLPRYLGTSGVGKFHLADSLWAIMAIITTFGMDMLLTKEIARHPEKSGRLFGASLLLRFILYLLSFAVVALYLSLFNYPRDTAYVVFIIGLGNLFWQIIGACQAVLQGLERMEYISLGTIAGKLFNTTVSIVLLLLGYGVLAIAVVTVGAALVNLLIQLTFVRRLTSLELHIDKELFWWMLRAAVPYLTTEIFLVIYMQIDIVIISLLVNEETVGLYGAADRLFGTLLFIPTVFITAVFPALSRMYADESESMPRLMGKSFDLLLMLSLPIGIGVLIIADPLVVLLFGEQFAGSGPVLAVMGIVLILTYQNMLLGRFLVSMDRQKTWAIVMAVAAIASIPLDLLLIPWTQARFGNGAIGGALAFVVTESAMLLSALYLLPGGSLTRRNAWTALRVFVAAAAMAGVVWLLRDAFILIPVLAGALVYGFLVLLFRAVPRQDIDLLVSTVTRFAHRLRPSEPKPVEG